MVASLNKETLKRIARLVVPFFRSELKWAALTLVLCMVVLSLSRVGMDYTINFINRDLMNALSLREKDEFIKQLGYLLGAFTVATPIVVAYSYTEQRTALLWRRWLSQQILHRYFSHQAFYRIGSYEGIDNPDQRIEEDIRAFTQGTLSLFLILWNSFLTFTLFISLLWSISINLIFAVLAYAVMGTIITYFVGRPLIRLDFDQRRKEANYRYKLVNVRDNAESIAFYRGNHKENTRARQRLKIALDNFRKIINLNRNLGLFTNFYNYLKPIVPIMVVAPLYLDGKVEFGVIWQSIDAFARVLDSLSFVVANFGGVSALAAMATRLGSFSEAIDFVSDPKADGQSTIKSKVGPGLKFEQVTIFTPKRDQELVRELTFELDSGGLLITGTSGTGKSSILRVIAGLWVAGSGNVTRPKLEECMFIPQRPYMVLGSLRNQLLYVLKRRGISNKELTSVLEQVGLEDTLRRAKGFDTVQDWPNILSTGEQQRLAFARVILAKPRYIFLDESTTAVDVESEAKLYRLLDGMTEMHVSIGYKAALSGYHDHMLELLGNGEWKLRKTR